LLLQLVRGLQLLQLFLELPPQLLVTWLLLLLLLLVMSLE
jgi:hypothetical protein